MDILERQMTKAEIKNSGATFTPLKLAEYLADRIVSNLNDSEARLSVLDPACGHGELLMSLANKLVQRRIKFHITGYEVNNEYLDVSKSRLDHLGDKTSSFIHEDFLDTIDLLDNNLSFDFGKSCNDHLNFYDLIIANPPYVRTQLLGAEKAQSLSRKFNLTGRVDLYHPFFIAMTNSLKPGGIMGVITSNKYLFNKSGESIRKYLTQNFEILEVIDLGDTKLFDAAVLPAIFIGRKKSSVNLTRPAAFTRIYEDSSQKVTAFEKVGSIYDAIASQSAGYYFTGNKI